jgi:hypothetical protein
MVKATFANFPGGFTQVTSTKVLKEDIEKELKASGQGAKASC